MPIKFKDDHTCEKCGKVFEWNYFEQERQKNNSQQSASEPMPHGLTLVHSCHQKDNDIFDIEVNCPHCDYDNHFAFIVKRQ